MYLQDYDVKSVVHIGEEEKLHSLKETLATEEVEASVILAAIIKLHTRFVVSFVVSF